MSILGLDIGTTGVKAVAFREEGDLLASAYREYGLESPAPGHLELDPRAVLRAIRDVLGEIASATSGDPIRSIATSTLGEAAVPVDAGGRPLGNAIIGFDARGHEEMKELESRLCNREVFAITGHGINSYHTLFKVLWLRKHEPEVFRRARRFLCFADLFMASLGLPPHIDHSMASRTLAFDIHRKVWSAEILGAVGLEDIFAPPAAPGERVGEIGENDLGLPRGCVVSAGLHDQPAGILGAGIQPGESMLATGTTVCLGVRLQEPPHPEPMIANNLCYYPAFGHEPWISISWNFTGGSLLRWFRDQFAVAERAEAVKEGVDPYEVICAGLPEAPTDLLVLPHFTTAGPPSLDPRALGAILGLRLTTTRTEFAKALLEGIAYDVALNADLLSAAGVSIDGYKAIGGAAKSGVWMQLYADVLDRPVTVLDVTESAALGAATMGAHGAGLLRSEADVRAVVKNAGRSGRVYRPDPDRASQYRRRFEIYRDVYGTTKSLTHRLFELTRGNS